MCVKPKTKKVKGWLKESEGMAQGKHRDRNQEVQEIHPHNTSNGWANLQQTGPHKFAKSRVKFLTSTHNHRSALDTRLPKPQYRKSKLPSNLSRSPVE